MLISYDTYLFLLKSSITLSTIDMSMHLLVPISVALLVRFSFIKVKQEWFNIQKQKRKSDDKEQLNTIGLT